MIKKMLFIILLLYMPYQITAQCWAKVAAGYEHTLGIKTDGTLWAWGRNNFGQLGIGNTIDKNTPTQVGTDTDWLEIDASSNSMAQKTNGTLWTWGNNSSGQIGIGTFGFNTYVAMPTQVGTDTDWVKFSSASSHSYAIKTNGSLWGWGSNNFSNQSELGTGDILPHYTPFQIGTDTNWADIAGNGNYALALKNNNTLWGWGNNKVGALAIGLEAAQITVPTQTGNNTNDWAKIAVGYCCDSKMIKTNGTLWAMGSGGLNNIGDGNNAIINNTPIQVGNENDWIDVSTTSHTCAIKNNNTLWVWGNNFQSQYGNGTNIASNVPVNIGTNINWSQIYLGGFFTVGIDENNTLYSWGWNSYGQLGDGTNTDKNTITLIGLPCNLNIKIFNELNSITVSPNPAMSNATINYTLNENTSLSLNVVNNIGQLIYYKKIFANSGENIELLNVENYSQGIYFITLSTKNQNETIKFIKK